MSDWKTELLTVLPSDRVSFDESMREHTTFRIGGPADAFVAPKTEEELISVLRFAQKNNIPHNVIGNGSNLLVADEGIRGMVITTLSLCHDVPVVREGNTLRATAGIRLSKLANFACENSLGGLAFAHGIPGTLGAAIGINAGAYDGEMKDVVVAATYLDAEGNVKTTTGAELDFGYRHSRFCETDDVILSATLELHPEPRENIAARISELNEKRRAKQPLELPSAGSAFKRPAVGYAAQLIDECGLKGKRVGDAQVSEKHAGFVVNLGNATAKDVKELMSYIVETVKKEKEITLEPEIRFIP